MAFIIKDRVRESTTTTGTSAISLGGTSTSFQTFSSNMSNGDTTHYAIVHQTADEWEVGVGTWNTGNTLTRTTVLSSSNSNAAVSFTSGTKDVFMTYPATKSINKDTGKVDIDALGINAAQVSGFTVGKSVPSNAVFTDTTYSVGDGGLTQNNFTNADHTKLDGIAASANNYTHPNHSGEVTSTGDGATVIASNVVDADNLKVTGNGTNTQFLRSDGDGTFTWATPVDTNTTYSIGDGGLTTNDFTNADHTKLDGIATGATAYTNANAVSAVTASDLDMGGNKVLFGNMYSALSDLPSASTYHGMFAHVHATGKGYFAHNGSWVPLANASDIVTYTVQDGQLSQNNFTDADHTKLNAIEDNATADQTASEIRTLVESATDSNVFTDADHTKLDGIATSANNYTHPNHSGEVTSTADGATVIADNVVDEANLKVSNTPTDGYVLTAQSGNTGGLTWAAASGGGGGSPDLYAENYDGTSTKPSATGTNAIALGYNSVASGSRSLALIQGSTASGMRSIAAGLGAVSSGVNSIAIGSNNATASAQSDIALGADSVASGSYSVALQKGRASGAYSFTAVIDNNTTSYGAIGANSIAIGASAKATSNWSTAIGFTTLATSTASTAIGAITKASQPYSIALGRSSHADRQGKLALSSEGMGGQGTSQTGIMVVIASTTDATPKPLTANNGTASTTNQIGLPNNSCFGFTGTVIAREDSSATNDFAVWEIKGGAVRAASASTTALGTYNINKISESTGATNWSIALSADTTNGAVAITVTGEASHNIRWVATVNTTEVTY